MGTTSTITTSTTLTCNGVPDPKWCDGYETVLTDKGVAHSFENTFCHLDFIRAECLTTCGSCIGTTTTTATAGPSTTTSGGPSSTSTLAPTIEMTPNPASTTTSTMEPTSTTER